MTLTDSPALLLTSQEWAGHWHGFGPWVGRPETYAKEGSRRPPHPSPPTPGAEEEARYREAASDFTAGEVPPLMSGHWLMKSGRASSERTWTDVTAAVAWLRQHYAANPPFTRGDGRRAYVPLESKVAHALDILPRGKDVSWVHYTQGRSLFSANVVCCPNLFHPGLACPLTAHR